MTLVDSSVWIDHLRRGNARLVSLLEESEVLGHPDVSGELACGHLSPRNEVLELLALLPRTSLNQDEEVLQFVEEHQLWGRGLGWIDVRLLASARSASARLWTFDRALDAVAREFGLS